MRVLLPFLTVLSMALELLRWLIIVWVILSWILFFVERSSVKWRYRRLYLVLHQINDLFTRMTYPFLKPFRRWLRRFDMAGIDWSPLLLLLFIILLQMLIGMAAGAILSS